MRTARWLWMLVATGLWAVSVPGGAAPVTLLHYNYTGHGDQHAAFVKARAEVFMQRHPDIRIEIVSNAGGDYWEKLATMQAGGISPDVLELYPSMAPPFLEANMVMDLGPLVAKDPEISLERYAPVTLQGFRWKGRLWGIPTSTYQILAFYNVDMFAQAGLPTPQAMGAQWTWEGLIDAAKKLTVDENGDGASERWGVRAYNDLFRWWVFVHQAGGRLFDGLIDPTEARFTSPAARSALQFVADLFVTHRVANSDANAFYQGRVAVDIVDGPSFFGILPAQVGDTFRWDIAQLPAGPANNGTMVFLNGFEIGAGTKHLNEAWAWLKFLVSEESMREYVRITGRTPALGALLPEYARLLPQPPEHLQAAGDAILNPASTIPYLTEAATDIRRTSNQVTARVLNGDLSVAEALEQIDRYANQRLREARGE
ncbi:MAG TPA: sugar ABC transporter substrate-binding protein [Limnochordia bacterium]